MIVEPLLQGRRQAHLPAACVALVREVADRLEPVGPKDLWESFRVRRPRWRFHLSRTGERRSTSSKDVLLSTHSTSWLISDAISRPVGVRL